MNAKTAGVHLYRILTGLISLVLIVVFFAVLAVVARGVGWLLDSYPTAVPIILAASGLLALAYILGFLWEQG